MIPGTFDSFHNCWVLHRRDVSRMLNHVKTQLPGSPNFGEEAKEWRNSGDCTKDVESGNGRLPFQSQKSLETWGFFSSYLATQSKDG